MKIKICTMIIFMTAYSIFAASLPVAEINFLGSELSDDYFLRYFPFDIGDSFNEEELSSLLDNVRIEAQADANIDLFDPEYFEDGNAWIINIFVSDPTFKLSFGNFADPMAAGTYIEYKNLLGQGGDLGVFVGFDRHMLQLSWNHILGSRFGIQSRFGHEFFNPMDSDHRLSALGASSRIYFIYGANSSRKIGLISDTYFNIGPDRGTSLSLGAFVQDNSNYLLDRIGLGFQTMLRYRYFLKDYTDNSHRIDFRESISFRPFNSERFMILLNGKLSFASDELYDMARIDFSKELGKASWQTGLFLPVTLIKIQGSFNTLIGLEPGFSIGQTDSILNMDNPEFAVSLAPIFHLGHPVSLVFSPRIGYNISTNSFAFTFNLRLLPYTTELDLGW